jgi:hypothetical protein
MAKINSIKKGHRFELEVAKWLTKVTGAQWQRVLSSGGYATIHNLQSFSGDVYSEDPKYKDILVECKSYKAPVTFADINNGKSLFNSWLGQTKKEAGNRYWMLFFKSNRGPTFYVVSSSTDQIKYAQPGNLSILFDSCKYVCQTKEWMMFEVV